MPNYSMEFVLQTSINESCSTVKNYLVEWAGELDITECSREDCAQEKSFKIRMQTQDPTIIFDVCAQLGRIKSAKIEEG